MDTLFNAVLCFVSSDEYSSYNKNNHVSEINTICIIGFYPGQE